MQTCLRWVCACASAIVFTTACDENFEPIAPTTLQFSVFGYLDARADTQWIRVMPIREQVGTVPGPFEGTVTVEHLGTGQITQLRDSLFRFTAGDAPDGFEGLYVHNFWTTERIEPGATYRLRIERPGAEASEAIIEVPPVYGVEVWISQQPSWPDYLRLDGVDRVPFAWGRAYYYNQCTTSAHDSTFRVPRPDGGVYQIAIKRHSIPPIGACPTARVTSREVWAVASRSEWPTAGVLSPYGLNVAPEASNISNAVGFVGGIFSTRVPYESCEFVGGRNVAMHCVLRYGPESARISGTVTETRCGRGPIDSVTVTLRELDREPEPTRRIRETMTTPGGRFEVGALEPGMRYDVRVRAKPFIVPFVGIVESHTIHTDTIEFAPGEDRSYDVSLEWVDPC